MAFVQIIEFRTSNIGPTRQVNDQWRQATEGKRTVRHELLARDRSDPSRYFAIAFFDSCESAMENSSLPGNQGRRRTAYADLRGPAGVLQPGHPRGPGLVRQPPFGS
jgi:hypothetical protein